MAGSGVDTALFTMGPELAVYLAGAASRAARRLAARKKSAASEAADGVDVDALDALDVTERVLDGLGATGVVGNDHGRQ